MEIKIGKSAHACCRCNEPFQHDEAITSLIRVQDGEFLREDFCLRCWSPELGADAYSVWTSNFYDAEVAEREAPEVYSPLRTIFYEFVEETDRERLAVAYLAAQLLKRQKVFRRLKEVEDPDAEQNVILFTDRIGNRMIEVADPNLTHAELERGRTILMDRLAELESSESTDDSETEVTENAEI